MSRSEKSKKKKVTINKLRKYYKKIWIYSATHIKNQLIDSGRSSAVYK